MPTPNATCPALGTMKPNGTSAVSSSSPVQADQSRVVSDRSSVPMRRVTMMVTAQHAADASGNRAAACNAPPPGRMTISTPSSPASTAAQRRMPTTSPRNGIDNAVMKAGEINEIAAASASGNRPSPAMKNAADPTSVTPRSTCNPGRRDRNAGRPLRAASTAAKAANVI